MASAAQCISGVGVLRILEHRFDTLCTEDKKAGSAIQENFLMPMPPDLIGKVA